MPEIRDPVSYDRAMAAIPNAHDRFGTEVFYLLGVVATMVVLETARQHGAPIWITWIEVVAGFALGAQLQSRYNKIRLRETTTPDGRRILHIEWPRILLGSIVALALWGLAYLLAAALPYELAKYACS
ncbi:hypothetical protein LVB87_14615 [Lysobacter sp. KIS68-7]|uniref:hypothetical protein n=1 Tax=Lysobacter sp. KIS68-7 TaxID=2904252 RepID=UPI001E33B5E1|nr:hypothetical protein [Lysobacter sp. KIS68-7]UHQ19401.1 hypothetical protein LVB87_14615 [Lysobacter sp. KIS68-7]